MNKEQLQQYIIDNFLPRETNEIANSITESEGSIEPSERDIGFEQGTNEYRSQIIALLPKIIEYILKNKE